MKLTKARLKQIIKEEIGLLKQTGRLHEGGGTEKFSDGVGGPEVYIIAKVAERHLPNMKNLTLFGVFSDKSEAEAQVERLRDAFPIDRSEILMFAIPTNKIDRYGYSERDAKQGAEDFKRWQQSEREKRRREKAERANPAWENDLAAADAVAAAALGWPPARRRD
jgi:hypothetical protein